MDIALINLCQRGDIVVTQDYGVAALALGKGVKAIHQSGRWYTDENIDGLLVEHDVQVAEKAINAGCDLLLLPTDLNGEAAARYYDDYIDGIAALIGEGAIDEARIDASVRRILTLKEKHGLLDPDATPVDERVEAAERIVGSPAHHAVEMDTARQAAHRHPRAGAGPGRRMGIRLPDPVPARVLRDRRGGLTAGAVEYRLGGGWLASWPSLRQVGRAEVRILYVLKLSAKTNRELIMKCSENRVANQQGEYDV